MSALKEKANQIWQDRYAKFFPKQKEASGMDIAMFEEGYEYAKKERQLNCTHSFVTPKIMDTPEWEQATQIFNRWHNDQLRPEGRAAIYLDDEAVLIGAIAQALIAAKENHG